MPIVVPTAPWAHLVFDLLSWTASLALGVLLYRWRLRDLTERLAAQVGPGYFAALAAGAVPGAWIAGSLNTLNGGAPALSHSVVGALAGAIIGVEIYKAVKGIKGSTGSTFVGPLALGVAIGRWGCLFTGLPDRTYGVATRLPWAVDLGDGVGRHPVQVYESLAMLAFLAVYLIGLWRRARWTTRQAFHLFCIWYGMQRFAWEFLKPYPRLIGPFNLFHLICAGLAAYGLVYWARDLDRERRSQERALSVPGPDHQPV